MNPIGTSDALAAAVFAIDAVGLGGVVVRGPSGPRRDDWLAYLATLMPEAAPWRRVPLHVQDDRLLGGLDLAATLRSGRPIAQRGLLAEADGGIVVLAMAERLSVSTAAVIAAVIDTRELVIERHGIGSRQTSRIGVVALDEGLADDEQAPSSLRERLAFRLTLTDGVEVDVAGDALFTPDDVAAARARFAQVRIDDEFVEGLCSASLALGVESVRAPVLACRAARALAALDGRDRVTAPDAAMAAGLVLAPRATRVPAARAGDTEAPAPEETPPPDESATDEPAANGPEPETAASPDDAEDDQAGDQAASSTLEDVVLEAALAALPPGLLASIALGRTRAKRVPPAGRVGAATQGSARGRRTQVRRGEPRGGTRLNLIETLRAAAPWQTLRRREDAGDVDANGPRIRVRREDFHVWKFKQHSETTTVFVVDASGSAALARLAEAKGAVELLLADCYVRRDSVAVIAFRGTAAEVLLPPTRSLVRAKRSLAGLPGGGGTPLASGIVAAHGLADAVRRRGATPVIVLLTDGRANIARDGTPGRPKAAEDALAAARLLQLDGVASLLLDTSAQPQEPARQLAAAMGARYVPLPHAGAHGLSQAVRAAVAS